MESTPTGASNTGAGIAAPSRVVRKSRDATSRSIRGTMRQRWNASPFAAHRRFGPGGASHVIEGAGTELLTPVAPAR